MARFESSDNADFAYVHPADEAADQEFHRQEEVHLLKTDEDDDVLHHQAIENDSNSEATVICRYIKIMDTLDAANEALLKDLDKTRYSEEQMKDLVGNLDNFTREMGMKIANSIVDKFRKETEKNNEELKATLANKDKQIAELQMKLKNSEKDNHFLAANANKTKEILEQALKSALAVSPFDCCRYQPNKDVNILDEQFNLLASENRSLKTKIKEDQIKINRLNDSLKAAEASSKQSLLASQQKMIEDLLRDKDAQVINLECRLERAKLAFRDEKINHLAKLADAMDGIQKQKTVNDQLNKFNVMALNKIAELQKKNDEEAKKKGNEQYKDLFLFSG